MTWTLLTVTNDGQVHHSHGFPTKYLCEQAKSLALYGLTIEQREQRNKANAAWKAEQAIRWRKLHPGRKPVTPRELKMVKDNPNGSGWSISHEYDRVGSDGLLYREQGSGSSQSYNSNQGESVEFVDGIWIKRYRHDVKYAECIPSEPPENTPSKNIPTYEVDIIEKLAQWANRKKYG